MSEHVEKRRQEEQRQEELELQKKQLFAQRVGAAAAVASAAAAAQTAAEVERMRREASAAAEATARHQYLMAIQQQEMAERQEQMAEDQRITNFRQTVLTTLPLLKEEEKAQYVIEQLMPTIEKKCTEKTIVFQFRVILETFKFFEFSQNFFARDPDVKKFMIEGKNPSQKLKEVTAAYQKSNKELEKIKGSSSGFLALVVAGIAAFWVFYICAKLFC